jgi:hypothetical protein
MAHPFQKIFLRALAESTPTDNRLLHETEKLLEKGYSRHEVCGVLTRLEASLLDDTERSLCTEVCGEYCGDEWF